MIFEITTALHEKSFFGVLSPLLPFSLSPSHKISIPYGAIKRSDSWLNSYYSWIFQFLMVRLKVKPNSRHAYSPIIFQFLMVRLKAWRGDVSVYNVSEFQFLMVRLKASSMSMYIQTCKINLNSLWCD